MELIVKNELTGSSKIEFKGKVVLDLLQQLEINPETVLVTRNNEVLTEDIPLNPKDQLEILSVVSGG